MNLAQFIQANIEQMLKDWEEAALEIAPELKGEDSEGLRDHARSMLKFISQNLATSQAGGESVRKALGKGKASISADHAIDRVNQGLSVFQMVQEFRSLRARVTLSWSKIQRGFTKKNIDELVRFNEAVDQLIANSVSNFSALKEQETRLVDIMLKASPDPIAIFEPDGKLLFLNKAMASMVNAPPQNVVGKTLRELNLVLAEEIHDEIAKTVTKGLAQHKEFHHSLPSGHELYYDCQFVPVFDDRNQVETVIKTTRDITKRKHSEYQVWRSANFDELTGIPNRRLFLDRLDQTLLEAERKKSSFALLFIDLDRFKQANDHLGHEAGDRLLAQVAERLSSQVRATDTVARLGGDEFTLLLKETGRDDAMQTAKALLSSLERPFNVDSHQIHISGSVGLTLFPDDGIDVGRLLHNADQAMYAAKDYGRNQVKTYEPWMSENESEHMRLTRELDDALKENQLEVYYQPIIDTRTGVIARAEALLRWHHPTKGLLTPEDFLSVTEHNGITESIAAYVLKQAAFCSCQWRDLDDQVFPISVNESATCFFTQSLVEHWLAQRTKISLDEAWITIELNQTSFNNFLASESCPVHGVCLSGLRLRMVIDNFGIEPFSISALKEFRMESIKIDKELIKEAGQGGDADCVMEGIIAMAQAIGAQVVGVGVEREEQLKFLSHAGCNYAQGFLFSQPLRKDDFEALLRRNRKEVSS